MSASPRKAVVLLSGGLDSATATAVAKHDGYEIYALSFSYGQRQHVELNAARRIAQAFGVAEHRIARLDLGALGGSALTTSLAVPKDRTARDMSSGIPVTYVPARNTMFLAYALGWAEVLGAYDIFIGVNAIDYSGYPDCRPEFIGAFQTLANLATAAAISGRGTFRVHAPLIRMSKAEIIKVGVALAVDYRLTHSCYDPMGDAACGRCDACVLRRAGFREAGIADPTHYRSSKRGAAARSAARRSRSREHRA